MKGFSAQRDHELANSWLWAEDRSPNSYQSAGKYAHINEFLKHANMTSEEEASILGMFNDLADAALAYENSSTDKPPDIAEGLAAQETDKPPDVAERLATQEIELSVALLGEPKS